MRAASTAWPRSATTRRTAPARAFDVVDFTGEDAAAACAAGLLSDFDLTGFAAGADQTPAADDFATRLPCAVASSLTSEVLIYDASVSAARKPQHVTDIFDLATFPGKRGLKRDAMGTFELALLADGVAPKDVYTVLGTPDGIARAFAKLESIKKMIVWWEKGDVPATLVGRGDVVMSTAYNTRAYAAAVSGAQIAAVWDKAPVTVNGWGVLKSARDQKAALEFVKFATDSARLSQLGEAMPYGPARRSALSGISPEMRAASPSAPEHLEKAFMVDADFWQKNGLGLRNRFEFWLAEDAKPARQASLGSAHTDGKTAPRARARRRSAIKFPTLELFAPGLRNAFAYSFFRAQAVRNSEPLLGERSRAKRAGEGCDPAAFLRIKAPNPGPLPTGEGANPCMR